ncbi:C-C motif chemokine 18-like [Cyprinodon tularosa]|uniref:C-C motif chemokine 18-like n=1 Tax=Cyprinodon tularosa TaxID=77115 RepID=UPI0018E21684|nr:C-C motif chemokine 18-like [Cyprinodon tularosa]
MLNLKSPIILTTCLLLLSAFALQTYANTFNPEECCFKFLSSSIPARRVKLIRPTDPLCPMEGVIIRVKKGIEYCADPSQEWVKQLIEVKGLKSTKRENSTTVTASQ